MADDTPRLDLGLTAEARPVVLLEGLDEQPTDMASLLGLVPALASPAHAADLALAATHLAHGGDYRVITDPHAYEAAYRARLAQEDPNAPWREGAVHLHDFGIPDFAEIAPPRFVDGKLSFFAADMYLGVPYKVELPTLTAAPVYAPLPLAPVAGGASTTPPSAPQPPVSEPPASIPGVARPKPPLEPPPAFKPLTPEEQAARRTHKPGDLPR